MQEGRGCDVKNGINKVIIKTSAREVIRARIRDAVLAAVLRERSANGDAWAIDRAVNSAVDVLLAEFRMVRR